MYNISSKTIQAEIDVKTEKDAILEMERPVIPTERTLQKQFGMSMNNGQLYQWSCFSYFSHVLHSLFYVKYPVQIVFYQVKNM